MVNKPPFDKIDNPFTQVPLCVKKTQSHNTHMLFFRKKKDHLLSHPIYPNALHSPQNAIFICPLTAFPQKSHPLHA